MDGGVRGPFLAPFTGILVPLAFSSLLLLLPLIAFCYVFVLVYAIYGRGLDAAVMGIAGTLLLALIPAAWWLKRREQRRDAELAERRRAEEFVATALEQMGGASSPRGTWHAPPTTKWHAPPTTRPVPRTRRRHRRRHRGIKPGA
jgi:hypothetical protein